MIRMFLDLLDPDPLVRGTDLDPSVTMQIYGSKNNLIPTVLRLLYDFLSLKNDAQ